MEDFYSSIRNEYILQLEELSDDRLKADIIEFISAVPFAHALISRHRKRAIDLPKDNFGRIIVDLTNPHTLENMDFFRERALYFQQHGVYTHLYPNEHPQSEYMQFWLEEKRRCTEGYVRESDGEWITGYHYWYLNYCPIEIAVSEDDENDSQETVASERITELPSVWDGDYIYFHYLEQGRNKGKHAALLKTRGRGYSFKGGAVLSNNYYNYKASKSFAMASMEEYLIVDGLLNKTWNIINFIDVHTPWTQPRDYVDLVDHKRASYKDPESKTEKGRLSEIIGVTLRNDPNKARGKRGRVILWEEAGKFPGLLTSWTIARGSMAQGRKVFGQMTAFGTGGTEGADFEAMETLFYKPESYGVMPLINVFDKNQGKSTCALYIGEYMNREFCYDHDGNSNIIKALAEVFTERRGLDANALVQHKADYSLTPQEAVMRKEGTLYPIADLKDYLSELAPRVNSIRKEHLIGRLKIDGTGSVIWSPEDVQLINSFPLRDNKYEGGLEIFSAPKKNSDGYVPWGRYIAGCDPFDDDYSTTTSLGSLFVYDTLLDEVVAEYTGRPHTANEFYEIVRRVLHFYNAICNYENFNKGLFGYFSNKNCLHFLCDTPKILKSMDYVKGEAYGNKAKGTPPSKAVNAYSRRLAADWLMQPIGDESGKLNLHKLRSIPLIQEFIAWNPDGNFDRERAFGMMMILKEDRAKIIIDPNKENNDTFTNNKYWTKLASKSYKGRELQDFKNATLNFKNGLFKI